MCYKTKADNSDISMLESRRSPKTKAGMCKNTKTRFFLSLSKKRNVDRQMVDGYMDR